jgi:iron complex outermembrane recepter protein
VFTDRDTRVVNGVFCDPQLGCSDRLTAGDLSTAKSRQFSQEFRLSSDFDGPVNFSLGANFLRYDTVDKYYVFINMLTLYEAGNPWTPGVTDNASCLRNLLTSDPKGNYDFFNCTYIDPNPITALNDLGKTYFLSKNPYRLISFAAFGELTYRVTPTLEIIGGLRWTVDKKRAPIIPSWLFAGQAYGLPVLKILDQTWREPTGRLVLDWKPELSFADSTLIYSSYSRGYKAGGANPPLPVNAFGLGGGSGQAAFDTISATHPETFGPEFVNAFEVGSKNTLDGGRSTINVSAFYYDYKGYQISQIIDRSAVNSNFNAKVWGAELELGWRPLENLNLSFKGGYEMTRMADGSKAIDIMDRTAGHSDWVVARPFPTVPSNCILPAWMLTFDGNIHVPNGSGGAAGPCVAAYSQHLDPITLAPYVPNPEFFVGGGRISDSTYAGYPGFDPATAPNNGEGFFKDLSGNELPNAPHFTTTLTADYTLPLPNDWLATLHTDLYYQSEAWTRIFNTPGYDKLKAYTNVNLAAIFTNEDAGWKVMAYVKNVFDKDNITGAFLNSDDTGLTTNVFLNEPRLYGLRVTKEWTGGSLLGLGGEGRPHPAGEPYSFAVEIEGGPARIKADADLLAPAWVNTFRPSAGFPLSSRTQALDWGDMRRIKLTYAPQRSTWRVSMRAAFDETNGSGHAEFGEYAPQTCDTVFGRHICRSGPLDWATDDVQKREALKTVDFMVGKEVGIGLSGASSVISGGIRYADFNSKAAAQLHGHPDYYLPPEGFLKYDRHWHSYDVSIAADRSFKGAGPELSWEASKTFFGNFDAGHTNLDWSLSGGVLFGKQKVRLQEKTTGTYSHGSYLDGFRGYDVTDPIDRTSSRIETKSVSVPTLGASLGLSYEVQRFEIGAGYRWERYFNAIDGGYAEHKSYDRTIDGPYFKVSVGFGG